MPDPVIVGLLLVLVMAIRFGVSVLRRRSEAAEERQGSEKGGIEEEAEAGGEEERGVFRVIRKLFMLVAAIIALFLAVKWGSETLFIFIAVIIIALFWWVRRVFRNRSTKIDSTEQSKKGYTEEERQRILEDAKKYLQKTGRSQEITTSFQTSIKSRFNWPNFAFAGLLIVSIFAYSSLYDSTQTEIRQLKNQLDGALSESRSYQKELGNVKDYLGRTEAELSSTKQTLGIIQGQLDFAKSELSKTKRELETTRFELEKSKQELEGTRGRLATTQKSLVETKQQLTIDETLRIGNFLQENYNIIRTNHFPKDVSGFLWFINVKDTTNWNREVKFATELARHDLSRLAWTDECNNAPAGNKYYCNYEADSRLDAVLAFAEVQTRDPDAVKIEKILRWTNSYVHYESDINNILRAPIETLGLKSGDCDDYSILIGALFEKVGIESAVGFYTAADGEGHAMVLVRLPDLGSYQHVFYENLTQTGLSPGKWIIIEPQTTIGDQGAVTKKWKNLIAVSEIAS